MIPFRGPSNPEVWTGGLKAINKFSTKRLEEIEARTFLPDEMKASKVYEIDLNMMLRENTGVSLLSWITMGYWRKKQFYMLFALSARIPEFSLITFYTEVPETKFYLVAQINEEIYVASGTGSSKNKAKEECAANLIEKLDLWTYLKVNHSNTKCEQYLNNA